MSEEIKIRRATLNDVDFLVDTIVAAEKSGTDNFGLAKLFELSEGEMRTYIKAMLEEEIDGCEFSVGSFLVADHQGKAVSAFAGWVEGQNEDGMSSALLKSNLIGYCLPMENVMKSQSKSDIVRPLQIEREEGTYQLEYSYTMPDYRGKGIMKDIINMHIVDYQQNTPPHQKGGIRKIQVHVFANNEAAIGTYKRCGFEITKEYNSNNQLVEQYFPYHTILLMERIV